ncbi:MAG: SLBB domain-containing protein [Candidatus Accumulibacter sp.]|jgi:Na+-translocating ferredoxin:NAD+ oxidoreductase RnfC subunit|nr:SLBB domain-containing protein [Accumulibacter sp.]
MNAAGISDRVRAAGVVGAGGAGFPTHVKLSARAEIYLVNGAECEPLLKVDQQLAAKYAADLARGLALAMESTGAREGIVALKAKYAPAIEALTPLLPDNVRLHILKDVYPAGDEVVSIWMATGRRVPPGGIPLDIGVVVSNVQTLINVARAVDSGAPVTHRTLTVSGAVAAPLTVTVPVGTALREVVSLAGGPTVAPAAYINGGPMMGRLLDSLDEPVTKTTGGIIALPEKHLLIQRRRRSMRAELSIARTTCEQCRLCTELCPRHIIGHELPPHLIVRAVNYNSVGQPSVLLSALTCSECALCEAWSCPVGISPMRINRSLKTQFRASGGKYAGTLRSADPIAAHRLVPVSRLIPRLGLGDYDRKAPLDETPCRPGRVALKLRQHLGAPAKAVVAAGERVRLGQLVAEIAEGALGARIHASIDGVVDSVDAEAIHLLASREPDQNSGERGKNEAGK